MKSILLWAFLGIALAQQAPPGDIYVSGGGTAENPLRAFINLYQVGTEMTGDPGTDYDPKNNPDFPYPSDIQAQWFRAMAANGNQLTPAQKQQLIPCAAHLNAAIDDMERGHRIAISQPGNAPAQATAQRLYAAGRAQFALCSGINNFANQQLQQQQAVSAATPGGTSGRPPQRGYVSNTPPPTTGGQPYGQPATGGQPTTGGQPGGQPNNPQQNQTAKNGQNPSPRDPNDIVQGLADGAGDCLKGFIDSLADRKSVV